MARLALVEWRLPQGKLRRAGCSVFPRGSRVAQTVASSPGEVAFHILGQVLPRTAIGVNLAGGESL